MMDQNFLNVNKKGFKLCQSVKDLQPRRNLISESSEEDKKLKQSQSTPRLNQVPTILNFEETSEKDNSDQKQSIIRAKPEFKTESVTPHFCARLPLLPITLSKMSVEHKANAPNPVRQPPPPSGSGR